MGVIRCQCIFVSCFTFSLNGDLVELFLSHFISGVCPIMQHPARSKLGFILLFFSGKDRVPPGGRMTTAVDLFEILLYKISFANCTSTFCPHSFNHSPIYLFLRLCKKRFFIQDLEVLARASNFFHSKRAPLSF